MLLILFLNYWLVLFDSYPIAELVIPIGIPSKEAKTEIEIHIVAEAKIRNYSI